MKYEQYLSISRIVYVQVRITHNTGYHKHQVYIKNINHQPHEYHTSTLFVFLQFCPLSCDYLGIWKALGLRALVEPERSSTICRRNIGLIDAGPLLKRTAECVARCCEHAVTKKRSGLKIKWR